MGRVMNCVWRGASPLVLALLTLPSAARAQEAAPPTGDAPPPVSAPANGKRILSSPIWLYCDDTSGNTSKKWNKHNSVLFTLAGLPAKIAHKLYNIHFVGTSNIASPLEMMEHVRDVLQYVTLTPP